MDDIQKATVEALRARLTSDGASMRAIVETIGGHSGAKGAWRFYSNHFPTGGIDRWNSSEWRQAWPGLATHPIVFFGEDVFGNQFGFGDSTMSEVLIWDHETGQITASGLDLLTILEAVLEAGIDWIDMYENGSLEAAREYLKDFALLPLQEHAHWVTPLILGGSATSLNLSVVDRDQHLIGHAMLWRQIGDFPAGTEIVL